MTSNLERHNWANWYGNVTASPVSIARPTTEDEVSRAVIDAVSEGLVIRPVGAGHSNVPVAATDGAMVSLDRLSGLVDLNTSAMTATFRAGTTVASAGSMLWEHGLSLYNQGDINSQHLAGAVSTATHGTGITLGSFSDRLASARLVMADGNVIEISEHDPDLLRAVRTSIGALGILTEVTLYVLPAFSLEMNVEVTTWDDLVDRWHQLLRSHRHFTFYWCPKGTNPWAPVPETDSSAVGKENVMIKTMDSLPAGEPPRGEKYVSPFVGPAYTVWADTYDKDFHELEYMVPVENGIEAMGAVRDLMTSTFPDERIPVEVRFCGPDDAMLSPMSARESCVISVSGRMGADNTSLLRESDRILRAFSARAHWGKWHEFDARDLSRLYPQFGRFSEIREELDSRGTFLSPYLKSMLVPNAD